jgi:serine/threonine-protein kinase
MTMDVAAIRARLAAALEGSLELGELLGTGGFAAVFRARDPFLERDVAIKVLDPSLGVSADLGAQFLREARIIAGTEHPHIVPLYAAEARDGLLYLVMRLLPGQSLATRIARDKLPPAEAGRLALEVARALATAHAKGVVHRDIKPANILLDAAGHAFVTDFGISRVTSRPDGEALGTTAGTPHYMSPEQAMGEPVDGRADVYSLGIILFEILTGKVPFEGRNLKELVARHISAPVPSVADLVPKTPRPLVMLVQRMMAKEPAQRPDAAELVTALEAATTPDALQTPSQVRWKRWRRRGVLVGVAVVSAGLVIAWAIRAALGFVSLFVEGGPDPVLLVSGPQVPDSLQQMARRDGVLRDGEVLTFAFIPAGATAAEAMLMTDSVLIRYAGGTPRRIELRDGDLNIDRKGKGETANGVMTVRPEGGRLDTLYQGLNATEVVRLFVTMGAWSRAREGAASDSAAK